MALSDKINDGIKEAMRSKDKSRLEALRAIKAALLMESTKGADKNIAESAEMQILMKLYKQRTDSAQIYRTQGREDLAEVEETQAEIIQEFLPKQMTEAEIEAEVESVINALNADGMKDMGKVMGTLSAKLSGKADGKIIAQIVRKKLSE